MVRRQSGCFQNILVCQQTVLTQLAHRSSVVLDRPLCQSMINTTSNLKNPRYHRRHKIDMHVKTPFQHIKHAIGKKNDIIIISTREVFSSQPSNPPPNLPSHKFQYPRLPPKVARTLEVPPSKQSLATTMTSLDTQPFRPSLQPPVRSKTIPRPPDDQSRPAQRPEPRPFLYPAPQPSPRNRRRERVR